MTKISKSHNIIIDKLERQLKKSNILIPSIEKQLDKQVSHLGKEMFLVKNISSLIKKYRGHTEIKQNLLLLLVKLYRSNIEVSDSLKRELNSNKKLLIKRIHTKIKAHREVYDKLHKIAQKHFNILKKHAKDHNPKKRYTKGYIAKIAYHSHKADLIYESLSRKKAHNTIRNILLKKLTKVYKDILYLTNEMTNDIVGMVKAVNKDNLPIIHDKLYGMELIIREIMVILSNFAQRYSNNVVHSEYFMAKNNKKIMLIAKSS